MKERWTVARMILLTGFSGLAFYILNQVLRYSNWGWAGYLVTITWIVFVFLLALSQPFYFWGKEKISDSIWVERLQIAGFLGIHYVSDILTLIMIRDLIGFPMWAGYSWGLWSWDGWDLYDGSTSLGLLLIPFLLLGAGYLVVWSGPFVRRVTIKDPAIPPEFDGYRIAQLSDVHFGPMMRPPLVRHLIRRMNRLKYEALVLTGDIVDCDPVRYPDAVRGVSDLRGNDGVYYCPGNHEYYWGLEKSLAPIRKAKWHVLINHYSEIRRGSGCLRIWGVPDPISRYFPDTPTLDWKNIEPPKDGAYEILLAHQPHLADEAKKKGFHLQLSGHTHAGQFFPWNLLIIFFQKYSKGLYLLPRDEGRPLRLYVNQGTGFWGPPTRLGTYGEITLLTLRRG